MKLFRFTVIEKEICAWWTEDPKIQDFMHTNLDDAIGKCLNLTIEFKKKMSISVEDAVNDKSIWKLKNQIQTVLSKNKLYGLKFFQTDSEISFEIYEKYVENLENCEFYRQRVRQYGQSFNLNFSEEDIVRIHPAPEEVEDSPAQSYILPMIEKQTNNDKRTYVEFDKYKVI